MESSAESSMVMIRSSLGMKPARRLRKVVFPELVPPLVQKLKQARPDLIVMVAGHPTEHLEAFKAAGVDDFIHMNANCHSLLSTLQKKMGVAQ